MLTIRLQRTGRRGHAQFRLVVQDSRTAPTSGRVVAYLGSYDPHTKATVLDKELASRYLTNGAQPSPRVTILLKNEGVKLPGWVKVAIKKESAIKNQEKLRRNRTPEPEAPKEEVAAEPEVEEVPAEEIETPETPAETPTEEPAAVEEK